MSNKWVGLLCLLALSQLHTTKAFEDSDDDDDDVDVDDSLDSNSEESSQVEVRSVFINCEPDDGKVAPPDSEATRFEREELFKHSVLRDCNKKLALTVKITSEPDSSGDEYLPIEHVFEGSSKKRIRLLDPYILRLRREPPLQAYKLRRVDTISGVLIDTATDPSNDENYRHLRNRIERDLGHLSERNGWTPGRDGRRLLAPSQWIPSSQSTIFSNSESTLVETKSCGVKNHNSNIMCSNVTLSKRKKRNEHNIVVEDITDDKQWNSKDQFYRLSEQDREHDIRSNSYGERKNKDESHRRSINVKKETVRKSQPSTEEKFRAKKMLRSKFRLPKSKDTTSKDGRNKLTEKHKTSPPAVKAKDIMDRSTVIDNVENREDYRIINGEEGEKDYAVYEIGNPELWYTVHVQLFEKLSTPDGKTVWNDLTKGEQASVSSTSPEWTGQDLNVRYRPAEWISREEFSLPSTSLCLLAPIRGGINSYADNNTYFNGISEEGGYIVVPEEDVVGLKDKYNKNDNVNINKRNDNDTESELIAKSDQQMEKGRRKVVVRTSRALLGGTEDKVNIAFQGNEKYLTLPHRRPHHAQIDLEARADENELVRVGASGRIAIAVADSTRRTRTIITMQVGNTGLAAARFRVTTRDCGPALTDLMKEKNKVVTVAGPVLIPPRHTRSMRLELPVEIPIDLAHCSVTLMNDEDKSVAVRDVTIKKGDRCFCVWHCDCVCLSDDPKLLCREMADSRQTAAGLSTRDRTRHARSACYQDVITLNICVVLIGVVMALLLIGLSKALLGLLFPCIGSWGLELQIEIPRKIDHYYESHLKCRKVEYDSEGWPVHPDTRERTIRLVSWPMEFLLNVIFFITVPCIVMYEAIKHMFTRFRASNGDKIGCMTSTKSNTKKCFSTQDMQGMALRWRRRRGGLRRWMTNEAQELSKELWKEGLTPVKCDFMRPLIRDSRVEGASNEREAPEQEHADSCADSEQDDTDYVLNQMQKSRESLSILKQKSKP